MEPDKPGDWIRAALVLFPDEVTELPAAEAAVIRTSIETRFLLPGYEWWWDRLRSGVAFWMTAKGWEGRNLLPELCPDVPAWFFPVYNDEGEVFRARPAVISKILIECPDEEYAVVDTNLEWIVIENHHGNLYGAGEPISSRLLAWLDRPGAEGERFNREQVTSD